MMKNVFVIGMGLSLRDVTRDQLEIIRSADLLMGGRRHLDQFPDLGMQKQVIGGKIAEIMASIRQGMAHGRVVVLASGDPLLFGIGARIIAELGGDRVTVLPNISSVAAAFARINEPWGDARVISLHGRDQKYQLLEALQSSGPVAVLTDGRQSPAWLAQWLLQRGAHAWRMAVFEQMGAAEERYGWYALEEAVGKRFAQPNVVIFKRHPTATFVQRGVHLGMSDDAFAHTDGLITKSEVRAVTLAKLRLTPGLTMWDLGAGSGSVGIEAAALLGSGRIVAVEQKAERVARIRENAGRFGLYNLEVVQAKLPQGLKALPPPERVFIGGGGRDLAEIIGRAADLLAHDGVMVANTVLIDNLALAVKAMHAKGLQTEVVQMQISRSRAMPWSRRFEAQNPVWIVSGNR